MLFLVTTFQLLGSHMTTWKSDFEGILSSFHRAFVPPNPVN